MNGHKQQNPHSAFTLVELLVVIAIIALLIAILIPTLAGARDQARGVACRSNMKQLMNGMFYYIADDGAFPGTHGLFYFQSLFGAPWPRIPGVTWDGARDRIEGVNVTPPYTEPYYLDPEFVDHVPTKGTLFPYVEEERLYLCPSDRPGPAQDTPAGGGGNGRLSYSLNAYAGYQPPERLGGFTYVADSLNNALPDGEHTRTFSAGQHVTFAAARFMTLFEEHTSYHLNAAFPEGSFNGLDRIATRHGLTTGPDDPKPKGRANIAFLDGHVDNPVYPARTGGRELFAEVGQPYFWRDGQPPDQANVAAFIPNLGPCPW